MIIITINHFIIIVNFRNHFDKALTEIFQFAGPSLLLGVHAPQVRNYCFKVMQNQT